MKPECRELRTLTGIMRTSETGGEKGDLVNPRDRE